MNLVRTRTYADVSMHAYACDACPVKCRLEMGVIGVCGEPDPDRLSRLRCPSLGRPPAAWRSEGVQGVAPLTLSVASTAPRGAGPPYLYACTTCLNAPCLLEADGIVRRDVCVANIRPIASFNPVSHEYP